MPITIAPLTAAQVAPAERLFRLAFGTFTRLENPLSFGGDTNYTRTRWQTDPEGALVALRDGELVAANFALRWGRFGIFGPLSVRPDLWDQGIARVLLDATMERFAGWGITDSGIFTFADSAKHLGLYLRYGYYARFLTAVMSKPVAAPAELPAQSCLSALPAAAREARIAAAAALTGAIHPGLDLAVEIRGVQAHALGDSLLLRDGDELVGFAVCHVGRDTEAGSGVCYIKFGAVAPGPDAPARFRRLLEMTERFAALRGAEQLVAGVNLAREPAYRAMLAAGLRTFVQGVALHRDNQPLFSHPDAFVIDDWR
ncbi:MAG: GNAT family N-acetyltransferase [Deltaproteobacteria bacterium]|nr:GNAT family N-acetyltransferase [Deltaproteobacteria bacterium]